LTAVSDE
jgi:hypothetical protein